MKYILLFIAFGLISCDKKTDETLLKQSVAFNVDFTISQRFSGTLYDKLSGKHLIYFADPVSAKKMKFFEENGHLEYSVDLGEAVIALGNNINDIAVFSKDSIALNSGYTNKLVFVNSKGKVWKQLDLSRYLIDNGNVYEAVSSTMSDFKMGNSLLFAVDWRLNLNNAVKTDGVNDVADFYNDYYKSNYFLKIADFKEDELKAQFGLADFYKTLSDRPAVLLSSPFYTYVNDKLLLTSPYTDKVFEIDADSLSIKKTFTISSDYTKIGASPVLAKAPELDNLQEKVNTIFKTKGFIDRIFYDKSIRKYILIVYHESKNGKLYNDISKRPFSILLLDDNFKKTDEIPFLDLTLRGSFSLMTSKGLLIASAESLNDIKNNEKKFYLFTP